MVILVVDDIHENRYLLNVLFTSKGYQVIEAENGEQALTEIRKQHPQLIISDILMPIMDGFALCKEIKTDPALKEIPFVFYTATYTEDNDRDFALSLGAEKFLIKPMGLNELSAEVEQLLSPAAKTTDKPAEVNVDNFYQEHSQHLQKKLEKKLEQLETKNDQLLAKQRELNKLNEQLELLVSRRTALLNTSNKELEAFSSSIVTDIGEAVSNISESGKLLFDNYRDKLDQAGIEYLQRVCSGVQQMQTVLHDLTNLSRVNESDLKHEPLDISEMARQVCDMLQKDNRDRQVDIRISGGMRTFGDPELMKIALENLLTNAWKFTGNENHPVIEVGEQNEGGEQVFFVRDNGVGFNMGYAEKLFLPFKDQHPETGFGGSGIGLATVQRIIHRHNGYIWAHSEPNKATSFYFSLPG